MKIENSYLMWIGSEHYDTIGDYSDEAIALGVSKRLPSPAVAREMVKPGTVVFVAHDEGETHDCPKCLGTIDCPDCRKRIVEMTALRAAVMKVRSRFEDFIAEAPRGQKRFVEIREEKINKLEDACSECETCEGAGQLAAGTGGKVVLRDGKTMDYRAFNYWLHQPSKFDPNKEVRSRHMCRHCGGTGTLPDAKVFGMFIPQDIEYILTGDESEKALESVKDFTKVDGASLKLEARRKCGYRKPGGVYVVTSTKGDKKRTRAAVKDLVERGLVSADSAEIHGAFVRFTCPIRIDAKRFRGIARMPLDKLGGGVKDEASMIADAIEATP